MLVIKRLTMSKIKDFFNKIRHSYYSIGKGYLSSRGTITIGGKVMEDIEATLYNLPVKDSLFLRRDFVFPLQEFFVYSCGDLGYLDPFWRQEVLPVFRDIAPCPFSVP